MNVQIEDFLAGTFEALKGDGEEIDIGCTQNNIDDVIKLAQQINPNKKYRVVADWQWWDIQFPEHALSVEQLKKQGQLPSFIYTSNLLNDSSGEFNPGFCVRSTFLLKLHHGCIFETGNTFYVLVGKGKRKMVDVVSAFSIFF